VAGVLVPSMILAYAAAAAVVIAVNADRVPETFRLIFDGAFGVRAAAGGALGYTVFQAIRFGVARGIYSNESGLGTDTSRKLARHRLSRSRREGELDVRTLEIRECRASSEHANAPPLWGAYSGLRGRMRCGQE
jgi:Na+/alanine symporter